jgi:hypothetical protein
MADTLYQKIHYIETKQRDLELPEDHVSFMLKKTFNLFRDNQVLIDAQRGNQTIEDSLFELAEVNKGWKKLLPRKKNNEQNLRLDYIGELIEKPNHLETNGVFYPDNLITTSAYAAPSIFGAVYGLGLYVIRPLEEMSPLVYQEAYQTLLLAAGIGAAISIPLLGIDAILSRSRNLAVDQAKYIDNKIQELY